MAKEFDKIFRENIEEILFNLGHKLLGLDLSNNEDLPENLIQTVERQPDFLKKIIPRKPLQPYILHMEFHLKNEQMVERLLEYYGMLYRKHGLEILQYVFFFGNKKPNVKTALAHANLTFRFEMVFVKEISFETFLDSNFPEEVILAILGDFKNQSPAKVIRQITNKLKELHPEQLRLGKCLRQLEILSKMRKLQSLTIQIIEEMPWVYDLETDIRYKQGIEKGIEKGREEGIEKGEKQKAIETAIKAFQKGLDLDFVMELTGLERDELLLIQKRVEKREESFHQKKKNGSHKKNG